MRGSRRGAEVHVTVTNMKKGPRRYRKGARAESERRTRRSILEAAVDCFQRDAYDRVTIAEIAARSGLTVQTILRIYGNKDALFVAAVRSIAANLIERRNDVPPDDLHDGLAVLADDYRKWGDVHEQLSLRSKHLPELAALLEEWRIQHRHWVCRIFATALEPLNARTRRQTIALLVVALGIETYRRLRAERLSHSATTQAMRHLTEVVLGRLTVKS